MLGLFIFCDCAVRIYCRIKGSWLLLSMRLWNIVMSCNKFWIPVICSRWKSLWRMCIWQRF